MRCKSLLKFRLKKFRHLQRFAVADRHHRNPMKNGRQTPQESNENCKQKPQESNKNFKQTPQESNKNCKQTPQESNKNCKQTAQESDYNLTSLSSCYNIRFTSYECYDLTPI
uniref:Uncharacterized protein n=1 Tax=Cacopsylla melanoneura TaxID=428564 RepID=A0A8D8LEN5_9HEMI